MLFVDVFVESFLAIRVVNAGVNTEESSPEYRRGKHTSQSMYVTDL